MELTAMFIADYYCLIKGKNLHWRSSQCLDHALGLPRDLQNFVIPWTQREEGTLEKSVDVISEI